MGKIADYILTVPSDHNIHIIESERQGIKIVLSLWGCEARSATSSGNPLEKIREDLQTQYTTVFVKVQNSDKSVYAKSDAVFQFKDVEKNITTDDDGGIYLGQIKNGSHFNILHPSKSDESINSFVVESAKENYFAIFPIYWDIKVLVVNQENTPLLGKEIRVSKGINSFDKISNEQGEFVLIDLLINEEELTLADKNNPNTSKNFKITTNDDQIVFQIHTQILSDVKITIIDQDNNSVPNYPIKLSQNAKDYDYISDQNGTVSVSQIEVESNIVVTDGNNPYNNAEYIVKKDENDFEFRIKNEAKIPVTIRILDKKNGPITNLGLDINSQSGLLQKQTNNAGEVDVPFGIFKQGEKVRVSFDLEDKSGKSKKISKSFKYFSTQNLYIIKLVNYWKYLWLLLLVFPFLLLIECNKNIVIKTIETDSDTTLSGVGVNFQYTRYSLYESGQFFNKEKIDLSGISDTTGLVRFEDIKYTLYSLVFKTFKKAIIDGENICYGIDTLLKTFHYLRNEKVVDFYLKPKLFPLDFKVINSDDSLAIAGAKVYLIYKGMGANMIDSLTTDASGYVYFENTAKCRNIIKIIAKAYGYYPDSIPGNLPVELLKGGEKRRTLILTPIKESIVFFVKDCKTMQPLPDAEAVILIDGKNSNQQKYITNVNGVGKGIYRDIHITKVVKIEVSKPYYKTKVYDRGLTVEEFIKLPDSLKTICLDPEELSLEFENYDKETNKPLAGVKNTIYIVDGKDTTLVSSTSNNNGIFQVPKLLRTSLITIHSSLNPGYLPNNKSIVNELVSGLLAGSKEKLRVPLEPKKMKVQFKTIDTDVDTLVNNAILDVFINGKKSTLVTNSGKGEFVIEASFSSEISIVASKEDYKTNDDKIFKRNFGDLATSINSDREIPMIFPPCNVETYGYEGEGEFLKEYNMGTMSGEFIFEYDTNVAADHIIVFPGRKDRINSLKPIFEVNVATNGKTQQKIRFNGTRIITVLVKGNSPQWNYTVNCPN